MPFVGEASPQPTRWHPVVGFSPALAGQSPHPASPSVMHASNVVAFPSSIKLWGGSTGAHEAQGVCLAQHGCASPLSQPVGPASGPATWPQIAFTSGYTVQEHAFATPSDVSGWKQRGGNRSGLRYGSGD